MNLKPENIPNELKERDCWVVWKCEKTDGRDTKLPYNPQTGERAKVNNLKTGGSFDMAFSTYREGGYDGIGYMLSKDDPFTGWDLDNCREPHTGTLEEWADKIVRELDSYSEISPSGTGIRIFVRAELPPKGRKKGNIEAYDSGHYLTITGKHMAETPRVIEERQEAVTKLHQDIFGISDAGRQLSSEDQTRLQMAFGSPNGNSIRRLYDGDIKGYPSQSEADQALCNHLAFWFRCDPETIDRVFRSSKLYREKWDKKHQADGQTYGEITIETAIKDCNATYQDGASEPAFHAKQEIDIKKYSGNVLNALQFRELEIPEKKIYLDPWLTESSIVMVYGNRGIGKTFFGLGLAHAVASGADFGPWKCHAQVPCLYWDAEMPAQDIKERLNSFDMDSKNLCISSDALGNLKGLPASHLMDKDWQQAAEHVLKLHGIKLLVLDNIASLTPGVKENSKEEWDPANQWLLSLRFKGITTILLHHEGKDGGQRGTSGREDNIDISIRLKRPTGYTPQDGARFIVNFAKSRVQTADLHKIADIEFHLMEHEGKHVWAYGGVKQGNRNSIIELLDKGLKQAKVAKMLKIDPGTVSKHRKAAIEDGLLTEENKLTETGKIMVG